LKATSGACIARIAFKVRGSARRGTLFFEYLRSYDRQMGLAALWIDGHRSHGLVLDGWWRSQSSQVETAIVPLGSLLPASVSNCTGKRRSCDVVRVHELNVQLQPTMDRADSQGGQAGMRFGKFKVSRVRACENMSEVWG